MSIKEKYHVDRISYDDTKEWILKKHYAHRMPSISYAFGLFNNDRILQGVCTFGEPASPFVKAIMNHEYGNYIIELNRLIHNQSDNNMTSFFVSQCLKKIDRPKIIISYSDEGQGHFGYIYQACNFIYLGRSKERTDIYSGNNKHARHYDKNIDYSLRQKRSSKHRYIYFIGSKKEIKQFKLALKYKIEPYPKGQNKNYDASYQPEIQGTLF
jgi:hypothetical protein